MFIFSLLIRMLGETSSLSTQKTGLIMLGDVSLSLIPDFLGFLKPSCEQVLSGIVCSEDSCENEA